MVKVAGKVGSCFMAQGYLALFPTLASYQYPGIIRCHVNILQRQPSYLCRSAAGI